MLFLIRKYFYRIYQNNILELIQPYYNKKKTAKKVQGFSSMWLLVVALNRFNLFWISYKIWIHSIQKLMEE